MNLNEHYANGAILAARINFSSLGMVTPMNFDARLQLLLVKRRTFTSTRRSMSTFIFSALTSKTNKVHCIRESITIQAIKSTLYPT